MYLDQLIITSTGIGQFGFLLNDNRLNDDSSAELQASWASIAYVHVICKYVIIGTYYIYGPDKENMIGQVFRCHVKAVIRQETMNLVQNTS